MIFSSYPFLLFFAATMALVLLQGRMLRHSARRLPVLRWILIAASLFFYALGDVRNLPVLLAAALVNYGLALLIRRARGPRPRRAAWLTGAGVALDIALLALFKFGGLLPGFTWAFPLGISFFTFQLIWYLLDCGRGELKYGGFGDFLLSVTFFPKLLMGPLTRHDELISQFHEGNGTGVQPGNLLRGLFVFSVGLAKKTLLATPLLAFAGRAFADVTAAPPLELWLALPCNLLAIYFDFSGYADMAVGLGLALGFRLPESFDSPLKARNVQEFWRRWNITVTRFLNDNIFARIYRRGAKAPVFCLGVLVTFLVSGLWHGSGHSPGVIGNFLLWGLLHGAAICVQTLASLRASRRFLMPLVPARLLTTAFLVLTAALFSCRDLGQFGALFGALGNWRYYTGPVRTGAAGELLLFLAQNIYPVALAVLGGAAAFFAPNTARLSKKCLDDWRYPVGAAMLAALSLVSMKGVSGFVYLAF